MLHRGPRNTDTLALIHTEALADGTISFKARGILAYLLSATPGFAASVEQLARHGTDGKRAVESGLKELEDAGYLIRSTAEDGSPVLTVTDQPGTAGIPTPLEIIHRVHPAEDLARPADAPTGWMPSPAALKTARDTVELVDIPVHISLYRVRCGERRTEPSSSEWLRWLLSDEQKLIAEQKAAAAANGERKKWWATASD